MVVALMAGYPWIAGLGALSVVYSSWVARRVAPGMQKYYENVNESTEDILRRTGSPTTSTEITQGPGTEQLDEVVFADETDESDQQTKNGVKVTEQKEKGLPQLHTFPIHILPKDDYRAPKATEIPVPPEQLRPVKGLKDKWNDLTQGDTDLHKLYAERAGQIESIRMLTDKISENDFDEELAQATFEKPIHDLTEKFNQTEQTLLDKITKRKEVIIDDYKNGKMTMDTYKRRMSDVLGMEQHILDLRQKREDVMKSQNRVEALKPTKDDKEYERESGKLHNLFAKGKIQVDEYNEKLRALHDKLYGRSPKKKNPEPAII